MLLLSHVTPFCLYVVTCLEQLFSYDSSLLNVLDSNSVIQTLYYSSQFYAIEKNC